jgi:hypothetical protein
LINIIINEQLKTSKREIDVETEDEEEEEDKRAWVRT